MIIFCDLKKDLCHKVAKAIKDNSLKGIKVEQGDIMKKRGLIVSASNPSFTMAGGLDALIAKKYPKECERARKHPNINQKINNVIFTVTVDNSLTADGDKIAYALGFIKAYAKNNRVLLSGLGTGIGGMDEDTFVEILVAALGNPVTKQWKFLKEGFKSGHGDTKWKTGKWQVHKGDLKLCESGFHASNGIYKAFSYVQGEILAQVECGGKHLDDNDGTKSVWEKMRVVKAYKWEKQDSVLFAIYAARLVLDIFEKRYPNDDRPRKAIEAAEVYVKNPTEKNRAAARAAAGAARAAEAAGAAGAAARAAGAAGAAGAAEAAEAAARAAWAAEAAWAAIYKKCDKWMLDHLKELKEIKCPLITTY